MEKSVWILSIFIWLFNAQSIKASLCSWGDPGSCGNMTISSVKEYKEVRRSILEYIWTNGLTDYSPLAEEYKHLLLALLDSNNDQVFDYAERSIVMLSILTPYMCDNPITCYTATMIDASVPCILDKDCSAILNALTNNGCLDIKNFYLHIFNYMYYSGLNRVDDCICDEDEIYSEPANVKCNEDGFVYKIDEIWDLKGGYLPPELKCIVKKLYESCDDRDRFIANIATYRLLDFSTLFKNGLDPKLLYEFLYLQYAPMKSHCCCDERRERLKYLRNSMNGGGANNFEYLTSFHENRV